MKTISVDNKTFERIVLEAGKEDQTAEDYLRDLMKEVTEIVPTKTEIRQWKKNLTASLDVIATERPNFAPKKKDSLSTLVESYLFWANEYNDGYYLEKLYDSRYGAYLTQEYDKLYGYKAA